METTIQQTFSKSNYFNYQQAFIRNLGWVTQTEQEIIRNAKIGIVGMGGVGGHHLHALARMGFSNFKVTDLDHFEIQNFNRQFNAYMSTLGIPKTQAIKQTCLDINPLASVETFSNGIDLNNMDQFLDGLDVVCDGLDLYASHLRGPLYELAHKKGIYVVSAGPFGLGTSLMAFSPYKMSFNHYFDLEKDDLTVEAKIIRFLVGMSPKLLHRKYIASPEHIDLFNGKLPSIHAGCYAASAALASCVFKIILGRGNNLFAPWSYQVDFYRNIMKKSWIPFGNRNLIQKFKIKWAHKMFEVKEFN
ncbi:MAG: ThiF family adenylyltransferase [Halobacteriovoraceae bacterium]|nr:ThiF family adenylyltransferase [Halobacteriovoraceae bacterium]